MLNLSGQILPLPPGRRIYCDLLRLARNVPAVPIERTMALGEVVAAWNETDPRPDWQAILLWACARVSDRNPLLRRCYVPSPRPHLYEHPHGVASLTIPRQEGDQEHLLAVTLPRPETLSLARLHAALRQLRQVPLGEIRPFRPLTRWERWPGPLRRLVWRAGLGWSGRFHIQNFGSFAISPYAGLGVDSLHPLSMLAPTFHHGPIAHGRMTVRLVYDHRVMDGMSAARILADLETVLRDEVIRELVDPGVEVLR